MFRIFVLAALTVSVGLAGFTISQTGRIARAFPPRGQFVEIDNARMHYTERKPDRQARATVLLLHGASGNQADMMVPLGDRLAAEGFRVLAFDRPGHGWSQRPGGRADASPAVQAALIRRAVEMLGVDKVLLVAHSLAGVVATNLAIEHQSFVSGLVLVAPVTHPWPGGIEAYYTVAATRVIGQLFTRLLVMPMALLRFESGLEFVFKPNVPPTDYLQRTGAQLVLRPSSFMANAQDVAGLHAFVEKQAPRLPEIKTPTAIVTGDSDTIVLTHIHSYGSAKEIPGATLKVLPNVGHSVHWAEPQAVVDAVLEVAGRGAQATEVGAR